MQLRPTGGGTYNTGGPTNNPPNLIEFSDEPIYDLATMVEQVGVRQMVLWMWEQQYGIPFPPRPEERSGPRRYSERDLVAVVWFRDQVLNGAPAPTVATRLLAAQHPSILPRKNTGSPEETIGEDHPPRPVINTSPLPATNLGRPVEEFTGYPVRGRPTARFTKPLRELTQTTGAFRTTAPEIWISSTSGKLTQTTGSQQMPAVSPTERASDTSWQTQRAPDSSNLGTSVAGHQQYVTTNPAVPNHLRALVPQLMLAFARLDTARANQIVNEALKVQSLEAVCLDLLQPVISRITEVWAGSQMTAPEVHFAQNYVRGLLFSAFHGTREHQDTPQVFIACAPRELSDLGALMLAVFWRRAGLRVVYFGQDLDGDSLTDEVAMQRPALVMVWMSSTQRIRATARIAKRLAQLGSPRPIFSYAGPIFARNPELQRKISGRYLGSDPATATQWVLSIIGGDRYYGASR